MCRDRFCERSPPSPNRFDLPPRAKQQQHSRWTRSTSRLTPGPSEQRTPVSRSQPSPISSRLPSHHPAPPLANRCMCQIRRRAANARYGFVPVGPPTRTPTYGISEWHAGLGGQLLNPREPRGRQDPAPFSVVRPQPRTPEFQPSGSVTTRRSRPNGLSQGVGRALQCPRGSALGIGRTLCERDAWATDGATPSSDLAVLLAACSSVVWSID